MIVIIDGYNLLKQIFPGSKGNLDKQKSIFIRQLAHYKAKKADSLHEIIVVFDAGPANHATREVKSGIVVVYSGVKSSADNWILHFVERNRGKEMLLVTLDRELKDACKKFDVDSLDVYEFYTILQQNLYQDLSLDKNQPQEATIEKFEPMDSDEYPHRDINNKALDLLMEQASMQLADDKHDDQETTQKPRKSASRKLSKQERRMLATLKKLS